MNLAASDGDSPGLEEAPFVVAESRDIELTPTSLAVALGCSRFKAYRTMLAIERSFPGVVSRRGKRPQLYAMAKALAPHVKGLQEDSKDRELRILRTRMGEIEKRLDAEVEARLEFQRSAHRWFVKVK